MIDLSKGTYVFLNLEWRLVNGDRPNVSQPYVEGRFEEYGCETGCTGYVLYLVDNEESVELDKPFYFVRQDAIDAAEKESIARNIPVIMGKDVDW